ncbi:hypothetical protein ACHAWO_001996 [Cyclotella atomus]|uniref:Transglutaminase-like domain-containing protein n=1 Tax=Cyclotella atomus TaxID=382360 RepID=A0ABD3NEZ6_9STRA
MNWPALPLAAAVGLATVAVDASSILSCAGAYDHDSNKILMIGWRGLNSDACLYETVEDARVTMTAYLWNNVMVYDIPRAISLGFSPSANSASDTNVIAVEEQRKLQSLQTQPCIDGLSDGILNQTLHYSLLAKSIYPWADALPKDVFMEYVVPFAVANEPRTDYRQLLFDSLRDSLKEWERSLDANQIMSGEEVQTSMKQAVKVINTRLWSILGKPNKPIVFNAGLTPRIYDPLSVIAYGHSSCTGLAILLIAALRSVGIAARLAGSPAWWGDADNGNHSWVEVFLPGEDGGKWIFLEPTPGIAEGDEDTADADDLDRDPCKRWFCHSSRFNGTTRVYATMYTKSESSLFHPMAWGVGDEGVVGVNRSDYYTGVCGACL